MNARAKSILFFSGSLLLTFLLYLPSLSGEPVWDDVSFWFQDPVITTSFSYLEIWKKFSWPFSVSLQKVLYSMLGERYVFYHALSVFLHYGNALLLYFVAGSLNLPYRRWLFILFLIHPASVITVAWMIQLKTLLCFAFAAASVWAFLKFPKGKRWMILSWSLFLLSTLSKSASIPLSGLFILYTLRQGQRRQMLWLIPFILISFFSAYRVLKSPVTIQAVAKLESKNTGIIPAESRGEVVAEQAPEAPAPTPPPAPPSAGPQPVTPAPVAQAAPDKTTEKWKNRVSTFFQSARYYFWHSFLPLDNYPVKGLNYQKPGIFEIIQVIFLILIIMIDKFSTLSLSLVSGYVLLMPFLGLFPAPYMNLTWVSDQHLYLALPFFIYFWLSALQRIKKNWARFIPFFFLPLFFYQVFISNNFYRNEETFYQAALKADALNVPIAYNLSLVYLRQGRLNDAMNLTSQMMLYSEISEEVRTSKFFPHIFVLHTRLMEFRP
jgi:hypothetical protein